MPNRAVTMPPTIRRTLLRWAWASRALWTAETFRRFWGCAGEGAGVVPPVFRWASVMGSRGPGARGGLPAPAGGGVGVLPPGLLAAQQLQDDHQYADGGGHPRDDQADGDEPVETVVFAVLIGLLHAGFPPFRRAAGALPLSYQKI